jgi:hypothetical protein
MVDGPWLGRLRGDVGARGRVRDAPDARVHECRVSTSEAIAELEGVPPSAPPPL